MIATWTWQGPVLGGILIGLASALLMLTQGRVAGISGILGSLVSQAREAQSLWRGAFVGGLIAGGIALALVYPSSLGPSVAGSSAVVAIAGLLVGFGTQLGNGCTSGHGVCGVSRLAPRSIVATISFMAAGALAVLVTNALGGA